MKRFSFLLMLTACSLSAFGQSADPAIYTLKNKPNLDGELVHYYQLQSNDAARAKQLSQESRTLLAQKGLALRLAQGDTLPDFIINVDQLKKPSPKQIAKILEKEFYSGIRPQISVAFEMNVDGYPEFRIPSVVATGNGGVIAIIEARKHHAADQAENDILVRVSKDNGATWGDIIVIDSQGEASLNNPCAVYVPSTKEVLLMYQSFPPKTTEGSVDAGFEGDRVVKTYLVKSGDGGDTWSKPEDITRQVKHKETLSYCSGPGIGVVDGKGRIVMPFNANGASTWYNYLVISDDNGKTWKLTDGRSDYGTNESQVAWIENDRYLVNARSHRFMEDTSRVAPKGWSPWNFARVTRNRANMIVSLPHESDKAVWNKTEVMENQPDPTCQGSILKLHNTKGKPLLLSNPANQLTFPSEKRGGFHATPPMRMNGTIKMSYDNGSTWTHKKRIYGNPFTEYQYSVLTDLGNGMVGVIFEANGVIKFARFSMDWLESKR